MARTKNSKTNVGHVVLSVLISSTFLLAIVLGNQNLFALTSGDRYTSGFSHGEQQATIDFQNNIPFNPLCVKHTSYYCAGYFKAYNVTWNNLAKGHKSNPSPNPSASNSTSLSTTSNTNTAATNPSTIISPSTDGWVGSFGVIIIIAAIAWKLKHRRERHKERHHFSDGLKEKVLEKQHHRCAACNRVLNVVDWHHRNGDRSDNRESNCVALCPNCHAIKTRRH